MFGDEVVEKEAHDNYIKNVLNIEKQHFKKYSHRKMTTQELDKICGLT